MAPSSTTATRTWVRRAPSGATLSPPFRLWDDRLRADVSYAYLCRATTRTIAHSPEGLPTRDGIATGATAGAVRSVRPLAHDERRVSHRGFALAVVLDVRFRVAREVWPKSQGYVGVLNLLDAATKTSASRRHRPPLGRVIYVGFEPTFLWRMMMRTHFGLGWLAVPCCLACAACSDSAGAKNQRAMAGH